MRDATRNHRLLDLRVTFFPYFMRVCEKLQRKFEHFFKWMLKVGYSVHFFTYQRFVAGKFRDAGLAGGDLPPEVPSV